MTAKEIIAVTGATGAQGGGLARAILTDPDGSFTVRALTRDPFSPAAKALTAAGAEVVRADYADYDSLVSAFEGAHGAFLNTDPWALLAGEEGLGQVRNLVRAAAETHVRHVVRSTPEDVREAGGATTCLPPTWDYESFVTVVRPYRDAGGHLVLALPFGSTEVPIIAGDDLGRIAQVIFESGEAFFGRTVGVAGDLLTGDEIAAVLSVLHGEPVEYRPVTPAEFGALGFPGAGHLGRMFQFITEHPERYVAARDVEMMRLLVPDLQSFSTWARHRKGA